jgi:hypothetical protein
VAFEVECGDIGRLAGGIAAGGEAAGGLGERLEAVGVGAALFGVLAEKAGAVGADGVGQQLGDGTRMGHGRIRAAGESGEAEGNEKEREGAHAGDTDGTSGARRRGGSAFRA